MPFVAWWWDKKPCYSDVKCICYVKNVKYGCLRLHNLKNEPNRPSGAHLRPPDGHPPLSWILTFFHVSHGTQRSHPNVTSRCHTPVSHPNVTSQCHTPCDRASRPGEGGWSHPPDSAALSGGRTRSRPALFPDRDALSEGGRASVRALSRVGARCLSTWPAVVLGCEDLLVSPRVILTFKCRNWTVLIDWSDRNTHPPTKGIRCRVSMSNVGSYS